MVCVIKNTEKVCACRVVPHLLHMLPCAPSNPSCRSVQDPALTSLGSSLVSLMFLAQKSWNAGPAVCPSRECFHFSPQRADDIFLV